MFLSVIANRVRRHLADSESLHRRIAISFLWVGFFVLIGKLAGAAKEMAIAWRYGVSATVDAYVFVFNLITWPVGVWFSVLTVVLVPLVAKVRGENPEDLPRFRGELLALTLLAGAVLGGLAFVGLPPLFESGWMGLSAVALHEALAMAGPLALLLPLGLTISLFSAWMMACGRHRNTLLEALPALTILVALLLPPGWLPEPLVWGSVAGFALQLVGLGWPLQRGGELQRPTLGFNSPAWQGFWVSIGIMSIGQALMSLTGIIDQLFAAHVGPGAIATLSYANRIMALVLGLGAMAISRATLPIFSEVAAKNQTAEIHKLALYWAKWMFFLGLLVMVVAWFLAPWVVELLFQHGAFTKTDTTNVSFLLICLLIQLPFYFSGMVFVTLFSARKKYLVVAFSGFFNLCVKVISAYWLVGKFQLVGLALSTVVMYLFSLVYFYLIFVMLEKAVIHTTPRSN